MKHWEYLKYVARHKLYVYQAGRELGVGRLQLLIHDWHKITPGEWSPYVQKFYGGRYPTEADALMVYPLYIGPTKESVAQDFDLAWLKHQKRGKHHWQWWIGVDSYIDSMYTASVCSAIIQRMARNSVNGVASRALWRTFLAFLEVVTVPFAAITGTSVSGNTTTRIGSRLERRVAAAIGRILFGDVLTRAGTPRTSDGKLLQDTGETLRIALVAENGSMSFSSLTILMAEAIRIAEHSLMASTLTAAHTWPSGHEITDGPTSSEFSVTTATAPTASGVTARTNSTEASPEDDGGTKLLEIPDKYRREMLADWRGAGRAIHGHDETASWYQKNKSNMQLHPKTRAWVESELGVK